MRFPLAFCAGCTKTAHMKSAIHAADPVYVSGWTGSLNELKRRLNPNRSYTADDIARKASEIALPIPRNHLTRGEVMAMFGVPEWRVRSAVEAGTLRAVKLKGFKRNRYLLEQCRALFGAPVGAKS